MGTEYALTATVTADLTPSFHCNSLSAGSPERSFLMKIKIIAILLFFSLSLPPIAEAKFFIINQTNIYNSVWQFGSSSPANNEILNKPPLAVTLSFSAAVNPAGSSISVYDPYNNQLQTSNLMISGNSMSVTLPKLTAINNGTYRVDWKALCQCGNSTPLSGTYYFSVQ